MKKTPGILILSFLILAACNSVQKEKPTVNKNACEETPLNMLTEKEKADGWQLLFDGTNTDLWRGFKQTTFPDTGWHAVDGSLMIEYSGRGEAGFVGDIITKKTYRNFDLKLEWKISPGGNSGILIYVTESDKYDATWHTALELQVLDDFGYSDIYDYELTLKQISGALYDLYTPLTSSSKPQGEWNKARVLMVDGHLQHWLNDELIVDTQLWTDDWNKRVANSKFNIYPDFGLAREGHIGLQDHGQQVWYRNIRILELQ